MSDNINFKDSVLQKAPLIEVAIGVQFEKDILTESEIFQFYSQKLSGRFPIVQSQQRLLRMNEELEPSILINPINLPNSTYLSGRKFFISNDQIRLVQIQPDRFVFNWRAIDTLTGDYPRFQNVMAEFMSLLHELTKFKEVLSYLDYLELTYIDHAELNAFGTNFFNIDIIVNNFNFNADLRSFACDYSIWKSEISGPLVVKYQSAYKNIDNAKVLTIESSCKGRLKSSQSVEHWFESAHEILKENFFKSLTEKSKSVWRMA